MFGFHKRSRSLIPVKDLEKMEKLERKEMETTLEVCEVEEVVVPQTKRERRNMVLIYLLFLVEAIMASSLSSQIDVILPSASECAGMDVSFMRSILQCVYYAGSATGIIWGLCVDKIGRRPIALLGLMGTTLCCIFMAFATSFCSFAILQYCAGVSSSAVTLAALVMLADSTKSNRFEALSRLPMIAVCGQLGPFLAGGIVHLAKDRLTGEFAIDLALAGQMACATLVFAITSAEALMLDETYSCRPRALPKQSYEEEIDCEKVAFLVTEDVDESVDAPEITILEALHDEVHPTTTTRPSRITITQMLTAPSVLLLLSSFSLLSLHSTTFDTLLPHLSHTPTHAAGMGIPCAWLPTTTFVISVLAALRILRFLPLAIARFGGPMSFYRRISTVFPVLYLLTPAACLAVSFLSSSSSSTADANSWTTWLPSATVALTATLLKTTLAQGARVLVLALALAAAPDAGSTGTLLGVVSVAELARALALALAGAAYYLSDDHGLLVVNGALWAALFVLAAVGAALACRLRETPRVGTDLPEECFAWQGVFDVESGDEHRELKVAELYDSLASS